jgi:hypothetical protein
VVLVGQEVLVGQVKAERKDREFEGETRGGESRYREGGREREREPAPAWGTNDYEQIEYDPTTVQV